MKTKKTKLNSSSKLYVYALVLYLVRHVIFGTSTLFLPQVISYCFYGIIGALLSIKLIYLIRKTRLKTLTWMLVFIVIGILMTVQTRNLSVIFLILFMILAIDVPFTKIARFTYITLWITSSIIVIFALLGVIENRVFYRNGVAKYALGFIYVGVVNNFLLHSIILRIFERRNRIKWRELLVYIVLAWLINRVSHVRGDFYLTIGLLVLVVIFVKWDINTGFNLEKRIWRAISVLYMPFMCVASFYIALVFTPVNAFLWKMNTLFSDRLRIANRVFLSYGLSPFARQIEWIGTSTLQNQGLDKSMYNYVDNGYVQVGIEYGLLFLALVILAYSTLFYISVKNKNKFLCLWIMILGVECFIYPNLIIIANNMLVVYSVSSLIGSNNLNFLKVIHPRPSERGDTKAKLYSVSSKRTCPEWNVYQIKLIQSDTRQIWVR